MRRNQDAIGLPGSCQNVQDGTVQIMSSTFRFRLYLRRVVPRFILLAHLVPILLLTYYSTVGWNYPIPRSDDIVALSVPAGKGVAAHLSRTRYNATSQTRELPSLAIFYHIYVPPEDSGVGKVQRAKTIVRQQLHHLSEVMATIPDLSPSPLYYTSIGTEMEQTYMQGLCHNHSRHFHCHQIKHLSEGFESHTLQALFDHCQQFQTDRVIYIHTKGSFHTKRGQNHWRRHMTDAVASRDCIELAHSNNCDLCGLLFITRPTHHYTGNMFNAKCSYIRKLVPPVEFARKMMTVYQRALELIHKGVLEANMFDFESPWNTGINRYAMEHWHGSHPSLETICDLSNHSTNEYWKITRATDRKPEDWCFDRFPRRPTPGLPLELFQNESKRIREYFLLPGHLLKWYQLYGELPQIDSWVWSWYPDGAFWKDQVQKYGPVAIPGVSFSLKS